MQDLPLWVQTLGYVLGLMFYIAIVGFLFFMLTLLVIEAIHSKRMKQDFINSLDDHDKSVVMQYKNTEYNVFSRFHKKNKNK